MRTLCLALISCTATLAFAGAPEGEDWEPTGKEKFEQGDKALQAVRQELMEHYFTELSDEQVSLAAVRGLLASVDPARREANKLMTPTEYAELTVELKGELIGIGVKFKFEGSTGRADVLGVVKGSPAEKAGLRTGDVILAVDGASFKGKEIRDLVNAIRGHAGTQVKLTYLRDAGILTTTIERQKFAFDLVSSELLDGNIGLLSIRSFNETTPQSVRQALGTLKGAKGLVIDLRDNEGGMLERTFDTLKLLLPKGKTMATLHYRKGKDDVRVNTDAPLISGIPVVVLINGQTRSSAELAAAALREGLKAPLLGNKSFGKWSVQMLKELPNHFVMRYTVAIFSGPDGKSHEGEGLAPDIEVTNDEGTSVDAQARTAINFLKLGTR